MPLLLDVQRDFRTLLLADAVPPTPATIAATLDAVSRVCIYRNNVIENLTNALRLAFPAVERLVGADFFKGTAVHFISAHPPRSADLYEYGDAFPAFLATFEPARGVTYLADVARLEWAVNVALHAPLFEAVAAESLSLIPESHQADLRFRPHPSLSLLHLAYPVKAIWEAVLTEDSEARALRLAAIDIIARGDLLAVLRGIEGLSVVTLSPAAPDLARALIDGQCLSDALATITPEDAVPLLGSLIGHGFFGDYALPNEIIQPNQGLNR